MHPIEVLVERLGKFSAGPSGQAEPAVVGVAPDPELSVGGQGEGMFRTCGEGGPGAVGGGLGGGRAGLAKEAEEPATIFAPDPQAAVVTQASRMKKRRVQAGPTGGGTDADRVESAGVGSIAELSVGVIAPGPKGTVVAQGEGV